MHRRFVFTRSPVLTITPIAQTFPPLDHARLLSGKRSRMKGSSFTKTSSTKPCNAFQALSFLFNRDHSSFGKSWIPGACMERPQCPSSTPQGPSMKSAHISESWECAVARPASNCLTSGPIKITVQRGSPQIVAESLIRWPLISAEPTFLRYAINAEACFRACKKFSGNSLASWYLARLASWCAASALPSGVSKQISNAKASRLA